MRTVHLDGCVEVEAAYYSTPPGWIGQRVHVQWTDLHVRGLAPTGLLLREHLRAPRGWHRIADPDRPARTPASTTALLTRARHAGPHLHTVCTYIHDHEGPVGDECDDYRRLQLPDAVSVCLRIARHSRFSCDPRACGTQVLLLQRGIRVNKGHHGKVRLDGLKFWFAGDKGDAKSVELTFEPSATKEQREGIREFLSHFLPLEWESFTEGRDATIAWKAGRCAPRPRSMAERRLKWC